MQYSPFPRCLLPSISKYSPQHHVLKHPQLPFLPQCYTSNNMTVICDAFNNIAYSLLISTLMSFDWLVQAPTIKWHICPKWATKDSIFLPRKTYVLPISCHGRISFSISFVCTAFNDTLRQLFLSQG